MTLINIDKHTKIEEDKFSINHTSISTLAPTSFTQLNYFDANHEPKFACWVPWEGCAEWTSPPTSECLLRCLRRSLRFWARNMLARFVLFVCLRLRFAGSTLNNADVSKNPPWICARHWYLPALSSLTAVNWRRLPAT